MINFLDIEDTIDFYNRVFDLFEHYENEIGLEIFKIKYENIVNNFQHEINSVLSFLDLEFESKLSEFYITAKNKNKISTPSYSQVINPLYTSSIGRWKKYDQIKDRSFKLDKWIKKFNY